MKNIRTSLLLALGAIAIGSTGCDDKESLPPNDYAYVSVTNAAAIKPTPKPLNVYVDGQRANLSAIIAYGATLTGTYLGLLDGTHSVAIKDTGMAPENEYLTQDVQVERGKTYAAFIHDTLNAGKLKMLVLPTDRTPAASGSVHLRFLHLVSNGPAVDLWLFKTATDSVRLAQNVTYAGAGGTVDVAFTPQEARSYAAIRVRLAGTNTNVASITTATTLISSKVYTIFVRGLAGSAGALAPTIGLVTHN